MCLLKKDFGKSERTPKVLTKKTKRLIEIRTKLASSCVFCCCCPPAVVNVLAAVGVPAFTSVLAFADVSAFADVPVVVGVPAPAGYTRVCKRPQLFLASLRLLSSIPAVAGDIARPSLCWRPCLAGNPACYLSTIYNNNFLKCSIIVLDCFHTVYVYLYVGVGDPQEAWGRHGLMLCGPNSWTREKCNENCQSVGVYSTYTVSKQCMPI